MHTMRFLRLLIVTLAVLVAGCRTAPEPVGVQTGPAIRAPFVYLIDYDTGRHFVNDPGSIAAFAEAPPDLVHVGKCVPILHNWGAVPLKVGENQFTGGPGHTLDRSAIRLLKPQELEERIRWLKQFTADWHATGVPLLMPYSSIHTIAGDHQTREGFWHFYDHWDDYAKWLGPRPKEDPFKWLMVDQKGKFVPGACGGYSPDYYAPLHRYRVCPSRPEWRRFQSSLTRLIAEVGYDGVFVDNSGPRNVCFCELCKSGFKGYVQALPASQRSRMGLPPGKTDYELDGEDTPAELIRRYRIASYVDYLRTINAAGRAVNERFMVFPNVGRFGDFMPMSEACQFYMFETSGTAGCLTGFPPPEDAELTIRATSVATKANLISYHHELSDRERFVEMIATVKCPTHVQVGRTAELACEIAVLGASNRDDDWAGDFAFVLTEADTGARAQLPLSPQVAVGDADTKPGAKRPPLTLSAKWTPEHPGAYRVVLTYVYTDSGHLDTTQDLPCVDTLSFYPVYRTHVGELLFTMNSSTRAILLDYECRRKGRDSLQELGIAECAAFSNGSAMASKGEPQRKYVSFFRRTEHLYQGARQYADIGLLYGYWGGNPGQMGHTPARQMTPDADLSIKHRLFRTLVDRSLTREDLSGLASLVICGSMIEMSDDQVAALREYGSAKGKLFFFRSGATLNGKPLRDALPEAQQWKPGTELPGMPPLAPSRGLLRGLRFSAFLDPKAGKRLMLHAVNYNVAVHGEEHPIAPVEDASISLTLPAGRAVSRIRMHSPDTDSPREIPFQVEAGRLTFTLPEVRIYAVMEVVTD